MKLPTEFDNPQSEFFVPEDLRQDFERLKPAQKREIQYIVERFAKAYAQHTIPEEVDTMAYWASVEELKADIPSLLHMHYLNEAKRKRAQRLDREEQQSRAREASRCPVCSTITHGQPDNRLTLRSLTHEKMTLGARPTDLYSCLRCYLTAVRLKTEEAQVERLGKKTRRELVAEALS